MIELTNNELKTYIKVLKELKNTSSIYQQLILDNLIKKLTTLLERRI